MARSSDYCVIQLAAHPARDERLNVGIAVFHSDSLEIYLPKRLDRLRALSAALDTDLVRTSAEQLASLDQLIRSEGASHPQDRLSKLTAFSNFSFSALSKIDIANHYSYRATVSALLQSLVEPEPAPRPKIKPRNSRLVGVLKAILKQEKILAKRGEGLESHRVVLNHEITDGLVANMALKNGAMHIIEAVDMASEELSLVRLFKDVGYSTLVFEQTRMIYGSQKTNANLIYQASPQMEKMAKSALDAAEHQGARIINWESGDDRKRFIDNILSLAKPVSPKSLKKPVNAHTSIQEKFRLN